MICSNKNISPTDALIIPWYRSLIYPSSVSLHNNQHNPTETIQYKFYNIFNIKHFKKFLIGKNLFYPN